MIFRRKSFVSQNRKFSLRNTFALQNVSGIEGFNASKRGGAGYHASPSNFFVSQCRKTSLGNISLLQKLSGIEGFNASKGGGGGLSRFSVETFSLTIPKNFFREHFGASEKFRGWKVVCIRSWYHYFALRFFCLHAGKVQRRAVLFFKNSFIEDFIAYEGERIKALSKNFVWQFRKISWGSVQLFRKFEVSKNFMQNRGVSWFPVKIICLTVPNIFGEHFGAPENFGY